MTARDELVGLAERDGFITPSTVVEAATEPTSALHPMFEWDDTEAAYRYRLVQAQQLIRRYTVIIDSPPDEIVKVRQFTSVPRGDGQFGYVPTSAALADPRTHDVVLQQAMREVAVLRRKYKNLLDFDAVLAQSIRGDESAAS